MASSKERISNPLALAVLVHLYEKPRHPYELSATLRERRKEQSIKLNYGSLYGVVESLAKANYVRAAETLREGRRPEKTVYDITPEGEKLMFDWMRRLVSAPVKEFPQFEAALSLLPVLPPEEVIALLEVRLGILKQTLAGIEAGAAMCREMNLPRLFSIEGEFYEAMTRAEHKFVEALIKDIRNDAGQMASMWRQARAVVFAARMQGPNKTKTKSKTNQGKDSV